MLERWKWHFRASRFQNFLGEHAPRPPQNQGVGGTSILTAAYFSRVGRLLQNILKPLCGANEQPCHGELTEFRVVTTTEVERFVDKIGKKLCDLDPIPPSIFKECKSTLLPILTNMVNMSLQSAFFPATLKEAMIKPKLKKDNLDSEAYPNFRPISNLKVL